MITQLPAGCHLIIDIETEIDLSDGAKIQRCLEDAATACGATILATTLHHFGKGAGVTGVLLLAESHISIHTWPEIRFAAVDIFMCGQCDPYQAIPVLQDFFCTEKLRVRSLSRNIE